MLCCNHGITPGDSFCLTTVWEWFCIYISLWKFSKNEWLNLQILWVICSCNLLSLFGPWWMSNGINLKFMQKIGSLSQQNATRCGLWWVEMLKTRDQYKEAAVVYFRLCSEVMHNFFEIKLNERFIFSSWQHSFLRNLYIQLYFLSKHLIAICCPNLLCYASLDFILFCLVIGTKNVIRYLSYKVIENVC